MARDTAGERPSIEQVKSSHEIELMNIEGVQGVGIGQDDVRNRKVIKIYVDKSKKSMRQKIPSELDGYPVDIEVSGEFRAF
jgi:hypothetical protein